jgi:hypothetical protein
MAPVPGDNARHTSRVLTRLIRLIAALGCLTQVPYAAANPGQIVPDMASSEYWSGVFKGDPLRFVDIRLAVRNAGGSPFSVVPLENASLPLKLAKAQQLWVVVGLQPSAAEAFPQGLVARVERTLFEGEGPKDQTLLFRGVWGHRYEYSTPIPTAVYEQYHDRHKLGNYVLRNIFHQQLAGGLKTDDVGFLWAYLFHGRKLDGMTPVRRCYLLRIEGLRDKGSWIPFDIGTDGPFATIGIDIFRLTSSRVPVPLQDKTIEIQYDAKAAEYAGN